MYRPAIRAPSRTALRVAVVALVLVTAGCAGSGGTGTATTDAPLPAEGTAAAGDDGRATSWTVTVTRVVDGDTMAVRFANGYTDRIRLLGVDTPELRGDTDVEEFEGVSATAAGERWLARWGEAATAFATAELAGRDVEIATDPAADRRDRYGRLLVYVAVDGESFNERLLREGYARAYDTTFSRREAYLATAQEARERRAGLWAALADDWTPVPATTGDGEDAGTAPPPATLPTAEGDAGLVVAEVHADAAGDDRDNLADEYVVFENQGDGPLDLSGWRVVDEAGHGYTFPGNTTLGPGDRLTLYTGSGSDAEGERYWGASGPVWNNDGDTVWVLRDGRVVAERSY